MNNRLAWFWVLTPLALVAMGWASYTALAKERAMNRSRRHWANRGQLETVVQRLDNLITVLVTRESELPPEAFETFSTARTVRLDESPAQPLASPLIRPSGLLPHEAAELSGPMAASYRSGIPSPQLARLYFELSDHEGEALARRSLPAAPEGAWRDLAIGQGLTSPSTIERVESVAATLDRRIPQSTLRKLASSEALPRTSTVRGAFVPVLFAAEFHRPEAKDAGAEPELTAELLLLRRVPRGGTEVLQGIWFDWPRLRDMLHAAGSQDVTGAELSVQPSRGRLVNGVALPPQRTVVQENQGQLAGLAVDLYVIGRADWEPELLTPTAVSLGAATAVFLFSLGALWVFLRRSDELARRRTRFASAVTHELRTPLTTMCMYAEMLEAGLVKDADAVAEYHATLRREGQRLAGLIDNVLAHAGLGEGRGVSVEQVDLAGLLDGLEPRLAERCARDGPGALAGNDTDEPLVIDRAGLPPEARVLADPQGLERVLVNLIDNACKYGAAPVGLEARVDAGRAHLLVTDAGPGIDRRHARRLFEAYDRGAAEAGGDKASRTEGLGLGLSLARGLCRAMGGDLVLEHAGPGGGGKDSIRDGRPTTFHVHLPLADPGSGA